MYEVIEAYGHRFEILYGYYADFERDRIEPIPIYPMFNENPMYSPEGFPLATKMQEPCEKYILRNTKIDNERCADCIHFDSESQNIIGICKCESKEVSGYDKNEENK